MITLSCLMEKSFGDWLVDQLNQKGMTQADLVRRTGISSGHISKIVSGERGAGEKTMAAVSRALQIPPEEVFRKFGLLPPKPKDSIDDEEMLFLYHQFQLSEKEDLKEYMKFKLQHKGAAIKKRPALSVLKGNIEQ
jgi:transcriptional regulator with XRE-family HTH domain